MPESDASAYAAFVATHEDRLVRSLVSETGLCPASARAVAADVLPAAHARRFAAAGAAYGWLRVAARHRAADAEGWADAADAALVRARLAAAALAALPPADREVIRLRYVDGLLPAAVAERLGLPLAEVTARLERAVAAAARALPARDRLPVPLPRVAAALAAAAAAAFLAGGAGPGLPHQFGPTHRPAALAPATGSTAGGEAAPARSGASVAVSTHAVAVSPARLQDTTLHDGEGAVPPPAGCRAACVPPSRLADELHVSVPTQAAVVLGTDDVVIKQEAGRDHVSVCEAAGMIPAGVASCVPGES